VAQQSPRPEHRPIPGERDPSNLTHREPGAVSGQFSGADIPANDHQEWLDDATTLEHQREGGGRDGVSNNRRGRKKTTKKYVT
jgi:hypothetical protein